jgi:hypothetical protein
MTKKEHLLIILMEECSETSQRASKALRFTLEEIEPNANTVMNNGQRMLWEFNHIIAAMEMLQEEGCVPYVIDRTTIEKKKEQVKKFLEYSKKSGTLE